MSERPEDYLEEVARSQDSHGERYGALLQRTLLEPYAVRACEMVVCPSFQPEYAVFLICTVDGWSVVSRELPEQLSGALSNLATPSQTDEDAIMYTFRRRLRASSASLPERTIRLLQSVWSEMLRRRGPARAPSGVDGVAYSFAHANVRGEVWSPSPETLAGRLVTLGETLALAAWQDAGDENRTDRAIRILNDLASNLADALGAPRARGELSCP